MCIEFVRHKAKATHSPHRDTADGRANLSDVVLIRAGFVNRKILKYFIVSKNIYLILKRYIKFVSGA